jgi:hypothetical protein
VYSTSSCVCIAVGISLNKITPLGTTGYVTIEQNMLWFSLKSYVRLVAYQHHHLGI